MERHLNGPFCGHGIVTTNQAVEGKTEKLWALMEAQNVFHLSGLKGLAINICLVFC
jgi:hypothetical protein